MWVYVVSESLGIGCMAMFAAFPSTIMEAASGRLHTTGAGARPIVVDSIMVDGKAANIAIQPIRNDSLTTYYIHRTFGLLGVGRFCCVFVFRLLDLLGSRAYESSKINIVAQMS